MAAKNKPAGIRSLVYGMGKGKGGIEGFERVWRYLVMGWPCVSMGPIQAERERLIGDSSLSLTPNA